MKINRKLATVSLFASALVLGLPLAEPMAFAGRNDGGPTRESRVVLASPSPDQAGLLSWLTSLLPRGLRLAGPAMETNAEPTVLATSSCFDSGAGVACNGFRSMREYLAAVKASQNLGIPFDQLKVKVQRGMPLHQAIHELRPAADSRLEALRAEQEAQIMLKKFSS
jgi:hypothetical protein